MPGFAWDALEQIGGGRRHICFAVYESTAAVPTGDGTAGFTVPKWMDGMALEDVLATVGTAKGITGTTDVQVRRLRAGTAADLLTTKVTIADEWYARDGIIDSAKNPIATGDVLFVDIDAVHSGTAPLGLSVVLTFVPRGAMG